MNICDESLALSRLSLWLPSLLAVLRGREVPGGQSQVSGCLKVTLIPLWNCHRGSRSKSNKVGLSPKRQFYLERVTLFFRNTKSTSKSTEATGTDLVGGLVRPVSPADKF